MAWDLFIGISLLLTGFVMLRHSRFKVWLGIPSLICGVLLLVLNASTAPYPPDSKSLFDAGPAIGLYSLILSVYILILGVRHKHKRY